MSHPRYPYALFFVFLAGCGEIVMMASDAGPTDAVPMPADARLPDAAPPVPDAAPPDGAVYDCTIDLRRDDLETVTRIEFPHGEVRGSDFLHLHAAGAGVDDQVLDGEDKLVVQWNTEVQEAWFHVRMAADGNGDGEAFALLVGGNGDGVARDLVDDHLRLVNQIYAELTTSRGDALHVVEVRYTLPDGSCSP